MGAFTLWFTVIIHQWAGLSGSGRDEVWAARHQHRRSHSALRGSLQRTQHAEQVNHFISFLKKAIIAS